MTKPPPAPGSDYSASDVLAPQFWTGRSERPLPGLDVACTKIAVDFQNLQRATADEAIRQGLATLRETTSADGAFSAFFDATGNHVESVMVAGGSFAQLHPEALRGVTLARLPYIAGRSEHLRMSEFRDTAAPRRDQAADAGLLAELSIGAALLVAFRIRNRPAGLLGLVFGLPRNSFDVNLQLLLKLLGSSLAAGLERVRLSLLLDRLESRTELGEMAANDGLWDFDVEAQETYFSPRWRTMLGYDTVELQRNFDWRTLVHAEDAVRVQNAIRDHVAGKTPMFESVHRMQHRSGEWRWVSSRAKATVDAHGRLLRLVGVELDVTERKLYEEALFREKESAQITLQSIGDGVVTTNAASVIDYINPGGRGPDRLAARGRHGQAGRGDLPRLPRGDLRAAREPAHGGDPARPRHQVGAADAADPARRQRAVRRQHRGADPRRRRPHRRRRARVPRRQRVARAQPAPELPRQPRPADRASSTGASSRTGSSARSRAPRRASPRTRCATSTSTSSRSSTTAAATAPATRCSARSARC